KNIVSELNENESYDIISQVISINFVNFNMDFNDDGKAHRCFKLIDTQNHNVSLDMMQMHIIEVPRFIKILNNSNINDIKKSKILSWIEFFTVKDLDKVKEKLKEVNDIMPKVIDKYERFISSEEEMEVYNARDAFLYGQTLMLKKEREEGIKEGIEQGIERGIEKGEKNKALSIAKSLKKSGLDIKFISDNTGLSIDEVEKL
ncbi:Rpn family recombination-promoting nuclease/putative transposase, partial [Brachyspira hyodysenteriae]|uniref:Rpn family recombination-promoting nuclease/putative transposase n=1 Tax=Brachyspira hyodysenteriae TaxID=159 RepID=UPI001F4D1B97